MIETYENTKLARWRMPLIPVLGLQRKTDLSKFEASLVYQAASSRTARTVTQRNPVSKHHKKQNKTEIDLNVFCYFVSVEMSMLFLNNFSVEHTLEIILMWVYFEVLFEL